MGAKNMIQKICYYVPVSGKTGLMTIGRVNMYNSVTFMKTESDGTKRLPDLESVALSKLETHSQPEPFGLSTSDIRGSSRNWKSYMCVQSQANIFQPSRSDMNAGIARVMRTDGVKKL